MTLALADANTGRLLRSLSLGGPTSVEALTADLALPSELVRELLRDAVSIGAVRRDAADRYAAEPAVITALVHQNRAQLLGTAA